MFKNKALLMFIIFLVIIGMMRNAKAQSSDPMTMFSVICWEPFRIDGVDKDYTRFHLGYWSTGGENFETGVITESGFAQFGSLEHETTSNWTTVAGSVDDIVVNVYSEDTYDTVIIPISVIFKSDYNFAQIPLSIYEIDPCEGAVLSDGIDHSQTAVDTAQLSNMRYEVPSSQPASNRTTANTPGAVAGYNPATNKYDYFYIPAASGVIPLPPPLTG